MSKIEITKFTPEEIDEAVEHLDALQKIMAPWFIKQNFDGMGEQDAVDCSKHLMMGKHALILMKEGLAIMKEQKQ